MKEDNNFLDKSTILSIFLVGLCWVGWSFYMKQKYPNSQSASAPSVQQDSLLSTKTEDQNTAQAEQSKPAQKPVKETIYNYQSSQSEFQISSLGMGVRKVTLKNHLDRESQPIVFESKEMSFFSTSLLGDEQALNFKVRKISDHQFEGRAQTPQATIRKTITFQEDTFYLKVQTEVTPKSQKSLQGLSLHFASPIPEQKKYSFPASLFMFYTQDIFESFVISANDKQTIMEEDLEQPKSFSFVSFVGAGSKYFGKAFINNSDLVPTLSIKKDSQQARSRLDYKFLHSQKQNLEYEIFYGPKSATQLKALNQNAVRWVDFGVFSFLARPMLAILTALHKVFHNWGFAIIVLTLLIRFCLLPLNIKSYKSMKVMQKIQPQMQELRKQYKDKPKEMNEKVLALMREHKANPFGSFLPILLQFPIFFALYRVLGQSVELYQSPFIFWIGDLSLKDPYFVLPVLAGGTFFVQQKLTPMNLPPAQARVMMFLPLVFSVFMVALPSGLTLYIFISGLFGLIQQYIFTKFKET